MANYATLKAAIAAAIQQNGNNEITGNLLQQQLLAMVNSLGVGYQYAGIATPATNPGTPDQNVFYLASTAGTYTNFGGLVLADGEIAILKYNGTWAKERISIISTKDDLENRLIKLMGISSTADGIITGEGQVFFNTFRNELRKCTNWVGQVSGSTFETVPFVDGAIYTYNDELYIWDSVEEKLMKCTDVLDYVLRQSWTYNDVQFEQGGISSGIEIDNPNRLRSGFIPVKYIRKVTINSGYLYAVAKYSSNYEYLSTINFDGIADNTQVNGYIRFIIRNTAGTAILPSENIGLNIIYTPFMPAYTVTGEYLIKLYSINGYVPGGYSSGDCFYNPSDKKIYRHDKTGDYSIRSVVPYLPGAIYTYNGELYVWDGTDLKKVGSDIPSGGSQGDVLTPDGWNGNYATTQAVINLLSSALLGYVDQETLASTLSNYLKQSDYVSNIGNGVITIPTLSQAVLDLISASGGGTIVNAPDDVDIETNANNRLQLKGGGVVRFRVKNTGPENVNEFIRCKATGLPIQIENPIDFINADGSINNSLNFDGTTLVFVGNGMIKNCQINGNIIINAGRRKIFDNVYFHKWKVNNVEQINNDSIYNMYLANNDYDVYNIKNASVVSSDTNTPINPFDCALTKYKIGNFGTVVQVGGKYIYQENGITKITFTEVDGELRLPITKEYVFLDGDGNVVGSTFDIKTKTASYVNVAPNDLKISPLYYPTKTMTGNILSTVYPEYFGATANDATKDCSADFQNSHIVGGVIELLTNSIYYVNGDIRMYGNTILQGRGATIKLRDNTPAKALYVVESNTNVQDGITIYDLILDGNKAHQLETQDGLFCDFQKGIVPFVGYSMNNTYFYNIKVQNFTGSGICVAVPGTSHIYSSYLAYNGFDGITWDNEHFTLVNVTCWANGRHGAFAGGNHWRIIGGAYAHNRAGNNIHCDGAFESQIIGCSCIDSGEFRNVGAGNGAYIADATYTYGYKYVGDGLGTHELIGGNGIFLSPSSYKITIIGVRVNNQNAFGIYNDFDGGQILIADCLFADNNATDGPFGDIRETNAYQTYISNTVVDGKLIVSNKTGPVYFGNSGGSQDWNNLKDTLPIKTIGTYEIFDVYNAANRPAGAGSYLEATVKITYGQSNTAYRVWIVATDENAKMFTRYITIRISDGVYTDDSGWKTFVGVS